MLSSRERKLLLAEAIAEKRRRNVKRDSESLAGFIRHAWHVVEPGQPYIHNWHIDALADHLEAVYAGEMPRLLANVPPGTMKSLLVSVFFVAWVWTKQPSVRFLATSHNQENAVRDSLKCRRLIESGWYQSLWGDKVVLTGDQNAKTKFENTATGFRQAAPFTSMTGLRADYVILDDPMSVDDAISEATRESINLTFRESLPTRLNNPDKSAIVVIMQRLHEDDTSGVILSGDYGYEHLCLPMRFDPERRCETSIGFVDPRTEEGELLFPDRFPDWVVDRDELIMGPIATAGQMQQSPIPRGGSILKRDYWQLWEKEKYPALECVVVSADTAYSKDQENDPSAVAVLGVFRDDKERPRILLLWGWSKRCELHGQPLERYLGETKKSYDIRSMSSWGLVEWIAYTCRRFGADRLLIENKASGKDVANEMRRLYGEDQWLVQLVETNRDKVTRAHAVEPAFAAGLIYAPDEDWAEKFIEECEVFPKGKHDDRVDALTQGVKFLRDQGVLQHNFEFNAELREQLVFKSTPKALYDV